MGNNGVIVHSGPDELESAVARAGFEVREDAWIHLYQGRAPRVDGVRVAVVRAETDAERVFEAGVDDVIVWPAERAQLRRVLLRAARAAQRWLDLHIYRAVYRGSSAWHEVTRGDVVITDVSEGFSTHSGYTRTEAIGRSPAELFRGKTHSDAFYDDILESLRTRRRWRGGLMSRRKDGSMAVVDTSVMEIVAGARTVARHAVKHVTGGEARSGTLHAWVDGRSTRPWMLVRQKEGTILECTRSAASALGITKLELLGQPFHRLGLEIDLTRPSSSVDRWIGNRAFEIDIDGHLLGETRLAHLTLTDITERKEAAELSAALSGELANVRDHALAANRAKTAFLASMSHELRTPLNAIIGYSELLSETLADEEALQDADRIRTSGMHLLGLVDEVLDLARVEAGTITLSPTCFDLRPLLREVLDGIRLRAAKRGFEVVIVSPGDLQIYADRKRLRQILTNLVTNAVKYATPGRLEIGVSGARIWVLDEGPGLSEEEQRAVFEPFLRLHKDEDGVGLGLSLCRRLAEALGGRLELDSRIGRGSRFTLSLPPASVVTEVQSEAETLEEPVPQPERARSTVP